MVGVEELGGLMRFGPNGGPTIGRHLSVHLAHFGPLPVDGTSDMHTKVSRSNLMTPPLTRRRLDRLQFPHDTAPTRPGLPPGHAAQLFDEVEVGEPSEVEETDERDGLTHPTRAKSEG